MRTSPLLWAALGVAAIAQLAVPAGMIVQRELTLRHGRAFKFRPAPVDPSDAFRGRFVALAFHENAAPLPKGEGLRRGAKVYATIEESKDGFARFGAVSRRPPATMDYVDAYIWYTSATNAVLELPFTRFYMPERTAPAAEQAYREHSRGGQQDAYAVVRVRAGTVVIEDLYVAGKPIRQFVNDKPAGPARH